MGRGDPRSQDSNIRDQSNGSVWDMMRVECLETDLQMETPRRRPSGEGWGAAVGGKGWGVTCRGGGDRVKEG